MMVAPRHRVMRDLLSNVVEVIRTTYLREPVVRHLATSYRWNLVMCSTGPSLLTATARQVLFEAGGEAQAGMRMTGKDYKEYGGKFKAVSTRVSEQDNHYMKNLQQDKGLALLRDYAEVRAICCDVMRCDAMGCQLTPPPPPTPPPPTTTTPPPSPPPTTPPTPPPPVLHLPPRRSR